jgi:ABC-type antimicrobial peptide transport system permease subunit
VRRAVESAIRQRNALVATKFTTMDAILAGSVSTPRFRAFLVGLFAAVAMTLALAGIYGLISYVVAQRTSEWGVRLALGATSSSVVGLILRRAAVLAGLGLAGGLAVAGAASRLLESMLFGLRLADPLTYLVASAGFALMAMIAAGIPALRAAAVEPAVALRE